MDRLTVIYDASCALCVRCRRWMESQPAYVTLEFIASSSPEAAARYGAVPWIGEELVVVSDAGEVWAGPAAFIVALWALEGYREWAYRMSGESLSTLAERFFHALSSQRRWIAAWLTHPECSGDRCYRRHAHALSPYR